MSAQHTPGPWIVVGNPTRPGRFFVVRDVPPEPYPGGGGVFPGDPPRMQLPPAVCSADLSYEDAMLIAAAPDLLVALQSFLASYVRSVKSGDWGNWDPEEEDEVIAARAAIAKTTWSTP